jgi:hypothetical protein
MTTNPPATARAAISRPTTASHMTEAPGNQGVHVAPGTVRETA